VNPCGGIIGRSWAAAVSATLALGLTAASARGEAVTPPRPETPPATRTPAPEPSDALGSTLAGISGTYVLQAEHVWITAGKTGITEIQSSRHWDAVGFFDGKRFAGLLRRLDASNLPADSAEYGSLRFSLRSDAAIDAVLEFPGSKSPREVRWTPEADWHPEKQSPVTPRTGELVSKAKPARNPVVVADDSPKLGEYVYVKELPEAITKVPPMYPDIARQSGVQGRVVVQALVGKDGRVKDTKVVKTDGPMLNQAAIAAVQQWIFKPALDEHNAPVAVWVAVPVQFTLH